MRRPHRTPASSFVARALAFAMMLVGCLALASCSTNVDPKVDPPMAQRVRLSTERGATSTVTVGGITYRVHTFTSSGTFNPGFGANRRSARGGGRRRRRWRRRLCGGRFGGKEEPGECSLFPRMP